MVKKEYDTRPLLKNNDTKFLEEMYKNRIEIYEKAHTIICNTNYEESLIKIVRAYKNGRVYKRKNNNICIL